MAASLNAGNRVLLMEGTSVIIATSEAVLCDEPIDVFNFTVASDYNYFVSSLGILVHNRCQEVKQEANKAVKNAWKNEVKL